jgi:transketolase
MDPIDAKFAAFGWNSCIVDGNDLDALTCALERARSARGRPTAIVARTKTGAGVPFLEGQMAHIAYLSPEDAARALAHLDGVAA